MGKNIRETIAEDEDEEDELAHIPKSRKTKKGGYLKDGFVVDSDENEEDIIESDDEEGSDEIDDSIVTSESENIISSTDSGENGSELTEESYDYSDDSDDENDKKK